MLSYYTVRTVIKLLGFSCSFHWLQNGRDIGVILIWEIKLTSENNCGNGFGLSFPS